MGLDIGITIKGKTEKGKAFLDDYARINGVEKEICGDGYEFGYWRKAWNIRARVYDVFKPKDYNDCSMFLSFEQLNTFENEVLRFFLDEKNWKYDDKYSLFSWVETLPSIAVSIQNIYCFLESVAEYKLNNEDFEIYFYDSY